MDVLEFGIVYKVLGHAEKALQAIGSEMGNVTRQAQQAALAGQAHSSSFDGVARASNGLLNSATATTAALGLQADALRNSTMELTAWGNAAWGAMSRVAEAGVTTASRIESTDAKLRFSLAKNNMAFDDTIQRLDEISLKTVLSRDELSNMVSDLAMQKINLFDEQLNAMAVTMANGEKATVSAAEVMQDAMAFSGRNMGALMFQVKEAASEQRLRPNLMLADSLNLSRKEVEAWNKELGKATSKQESFNTLMKLTAERVGGSTLAVKDTLNFTLQQIGDWKDKLYNDIFKGVLPIIRDLVQEVGAFILDLTSGDKLKNVRDQVTQIAERLVQGARAAVHMGIAIAKFVQLNPWVLKLAVAFGASSMALSKMVGAMGSLGGLVFNLRTLFSALAPMFAGFLPIAAKIMLIGAAVGFVATILARLAVGGDSFADTWARVGAVLGGVFQLLKNMDMDTGFTFIDEENAKKLEEMGLLGTVENIGRTLFRVVKFVEAMFKAFEDNWPKIEAAGSRIFSNLENVVRNFAKALGITLAPVTDTLGNAPDSAVEKWISFGITVGDVMAGLVLKVTAVIEAITSLASKLSDLWEDSHLQEIAEVAGFIGKWTPSGAILRGALPEIYGDGQDEATVAANTVRAGGWRLDELMASAGASGAVPGQGAATPLAAMFTNAAGSGKQGAQLDPKALYDSQYRGAYDGMTAALKDNPLELYADGKNLTDFAAAQAARNEEDER